MDVAIHTKQPQKQNFRLFDRGKNDITVVSIFYFFDLQCGWAFSDLLIAYMYLFCSALPI